MYIELNTWIQPDLVEYSNAMNIPSPDAECYAYLVTFKNGHHYMTL